MFFLKSIVHQQSKLLLFYRVVGNTEYKDSQAFQKRNGKDITIL